MKRVRRRHSGKTALDLIEEAVHLLRTAPVAALVSYCLGTLPFLLSLLYFWADMSRSPFAREHVVEAALVVALLFLWMKFWQALFARQLRAHLAHEAAPALTAKRCGHLALTQAALQPTGLFVLPLAALCVLPFPWVYATYQNLTALADAEARSPRELFRQSVRQMKFWPGQNVATLIALAAFGAFVFLNCTITCAALPYLLKTLLGIETVFSRGGMAMLNTTFFATMFAVAYLCVDPILKAVYVLRCFYGESIRSGADLRMELRRFAPPVAHLAALLLLGLTLIRPATLQAAETAPASPPATAPQKVSPTELDRAIGQVIQQRKYVWRMPRDHAETPDQGVSQDGVIWKFFKRMAEMFRNVVQKFFEWLGNILRKIFGGPTPPFSVPSSGINWIVVSQMLLYVLALVVLSAIAILIYRLWRNRQPKPEALQTEAIQPVPDLTDESVGADQLPEDGWTKLARELLARGEFRLALRAFYLASLAHLAEKNLLSLARFKSNHDYERELGRRAHSFPTLLQLFGENVAAFDRVWYGLHEVNDASVAQFAANVERIKTGG